MGILGGSGNASYFYRLLEMATSQLQLEPNWANILELCDSVRQKDVSAKFAVAAIRKKMQDKNPHVVKFALVTLEACMKNCGGPVHDEVATRELMDELRTLANTGSEPVKQQTLNMIQTWNQTLGKKPNYKVIQDTYNILRAEGHSFPQLQESEAMYSAEMAPEWAEGDVCHQCRVKFTTFTRQHHCRCCGQVFCAKCSSKNSTIPKFGIEREVRVCDACYDSINPSGPANKKAQSDGETQSLGSDGLPPEYLSSSLAKEAQTKPKPSEAELKAQEEEELQLAMALSLSAAEVEKQQPPKKNWANSTNPSAEPASSLYSNPQSDLYSDVAADSKSVSDSNSGELSRYLNRQYWERVKDGKKSEPSAPIVHDVEEVQRAGAYHEEETDESTDEITGDSDAFVETMSKSINMFINRMQTVTSKGKHIAMDSTVQSLFQSLSAMHPQLMKLIEDEEDNKARYEAMLEKIAIIREARESLDGMRNQHREKLRHQELEQEMLRRMQMEQKLELMRQQKQEYLEYQRQLQIQRQHELEAQQQIKMQQKQMPFQGNVYANMQLPMPAQMGQGQAQMTQGQAQMGQGQAQMGQGQAQMTQGQAQMGQGQAQMTQGQVQMGQNQEGFISATQYQQAPMSQGQPVQGSPMQQYPSQYPQSSVSYGSRADGGPNGQNQQMSSQSVPIGSNQVSVAQAQIPQQQQQFEPQQYRQPPSQDQGQPIRSAASQSQPMQRQFGQQQTPPQQPISNQPPQQVQQQPPQQPPQQPTQYPSPMPDLLDAPIGAEVVLRGQESRSQSYGYQQPQQQPSPAQQQQTPYSQQQQQPQIIAGQQQNQPQQQFASPVQQQQPQSLNYQQHVAQAGIQQQQQQPYYPAAISNAPPQGYQQSPSRVQTPGQFQGGQEQYQQLQANQQGHLTKGIPQQGPQSLPYMGNDAMNNQMAGPLSLPANMNSRGGQNIMGNQQYVPQNPYQQQQQHPQQQQQRQQQQQQQPEVPMTENMKDLQLISFE